MDLPTSSFNSVGWPVCPVGCSVVGDGYEGFLVRRQDVS